MAYADSQLRGWYYNCFLFWYQLHVVVVVVVVGQNTNFSFPEFPADAFTSGTLTSVNEVIVKDGALSFSPSAVANDSLTAARALYSRQVEFRDSSSSSSDGAGADAVVVASFSTNFTFIIETKARYSNPVCHGADGLVFVIVPDDKLVGDSGGHLGVLYSGHNNESSSHVFAVEIDTYRNYQYGDPSDCHVGVDVNCLNSTQLVDLKLQADPSSSSSSSSRESCILKSNTSITVSIDYDSQLKRVQVSLKGGPGRAPDEEFANMTVQELDLSSVFKDRMYVGFSAATGQFGCVESHTVTSWNFSSTGLPASAAAAGSKLAAHIFNKAPEVPIFTFAVVAGLGLLLVTFLFVFDNLRRRKNNGFGADSVQYDQLLDGQPRRFTFKELNIATKGFNPSELLGQGGFGSVYRGKLQSSDSSSSSPITWVAVKQLAQGSHQGQREFLAELTTISKIRHKNLVQLQGWCHERGQLLLVYDYMSNGSLDRLLDSGCSSSSSSSTTRSSDPHEQQLQVLSWDRRFHIVTGIVAALSYLHNEWQQCVLHRDVKPSNVMLDENFNAHLGDFGLARLIDHNKMAWTTMVAGTIGYMSPEFVHRGRATKQSDVYSFGALALEVACGRRPVDSSLAETEVVLLDCLWRAHERGELLCMMDPKLDGEFDVAQATCLLHVGLLCCHPDPDARPSMVLARQILSGDQPSPPLPAKRPHMIFDTMIQASEFTPLLSGSSSQTLNPKP